MKKSAFFLVFFYVLIANAQNINPSHRDPAPIDKSADVGVYAIIIPILDSTIAGTLDSVKIMIKNYGTTTVTSVPVQYHINGIVYSVEIWTGSLSPAATTLYQFAVKYTVPQGNYSLCAKTLLTGDAQATNDQFCKGTYGIELYPYSNWELFQNTPNPATDKTIIKFELPSEGKVSLELHDLLGNIFFRDEKECNAGTDQFEMDLSSIPSGVYFYSVNYNDMIRTRPMIITN